MTRARRSPAPAECQWIRGTHAEEKARENARDRQGGGESDGGAEERQADAVTEHQP